MVIICCFCKSQSETCVDSANFFYLKPNKIIANLFSDLSKVAQSYMAFEARIAEATTVLLTEAL